MAEPGDCPPEAPCGLHVFEELGVRLQSPQIDAKVMHRIRIASLFKRFCVCQATKVIAVGPLHETVSG
jgi:hypothetical protein